MSPKEVVLKNSAGQSDFRIKDIKIAPYGRKEIEMAEQGIETVIRNLLIIGKQVTDSPINAPHLYTNQDTFNTVETL